MRGSIAARADDGPRHKDTDETLLAAARCGDQHAVAELWRRHFDPLCAWARRITDRFEPEDLAADAFAQLLEAVARGLGPSREAGPYLRVSVRNLSIRRTKQAVPVVPLAEQTERSEPCERTARMLDTIDNRPMRDAFATLPERWQTVLWLIEVEGAGVQEASAKLGLSPNATSVLRWRAARGLQKAYQLTTAARPGHAASHAGARTGAAAGAEREDRGLAPASA